MKNFAKKFSALLLSLALVLTMMPFLAVDSFAAEGEKAFDYSINGHVLGSVDMQWIEDNSSSVQVFPWVASKGGVVGYYVTLGVTYDQFFKSFYGTELSALPDNTLVQWKSSSGGENNLTNTQLAERTALVTYVDETGEKYDGLLKPGPSGKTISVNKEADISPAIVGWRELVKAPSATEGKTTYQLALEKAESLGEDSALAEWKSANAVNSSGSPIINHVGGNMAEDQIVVYDGSAAVDTSSNFVGKFSVQGIESLNIDVALTAAEANLELTAGEAKTVDADLGVDEGLAKVLLEKAEWTTDNEAVATAAEGKITAAAEGTCTVKAQLDNEVLATYNVTVKAAAPAPKPTPKPAIVNGQTAKVGGNTYKVISASAKTAAFVKAANKKSATVPATVTINGVKLNVTSISSKAFKGTKVKTLTVKSKKLTKKSVKGSLKSSKVKTVKVKVGKKKDNKTYVKKYKKYFTKKNAGKKVTVK